MKLTYIERAFFTSLGRAIEVAWSDEPGNYVELWELHSHSKVLSEFWEKRDVEMVIASCGVIFENTLSFLTEYGLGGANFTLMTYIEHLKDDMGAVRLYGMLMNEAGIAQYVDQARAGMAKCMVLSILLRAHLYEHPLIPKGVPVHE